MNPPADTKESKATLVTTPCVFLDTLRTMSNGRTLVKLEDTLRDATKAARIAAGKAKFTIEVCITPNGQGVGDTPLFKVTAKVKSRAFPELPDPASSYYVDEEDNLTRRNPHQGEIKFSAIEGEAKPKVEAKAKTVANA